MGANYDMVIASVEAEPLLFERLSRFLKGQNKSVHSIEELTESDLDDGSVVLISPPINRVYQVVANSEALGLSTAEWYWKNDLAVCLSSVGNTAVHLWSYDSGFIAGYSGYYDGGLVESEVVFSRHCKNVTQIMDGVPTPPQNRGPLLSRMMGRAGFDFSSFVSSGASLEVGIGAVIALFGCKVHLVDFYEALDEHIGLSIENGQYKTVRLIEWKAMRFFGK